MGANVDVDRKVVHPDYVWETSFRPPKGRKGFIPIVANGPEYSLPPNLEWRADEPVVRAILTPILRLVTRFMMEPNTNIFVEPLTDKTDIANY